MNLTKITLLLTLIILLSSPILAKHGDDDGPNHDINDDKGGDRPDNVKDDGPNHDINDDKGGDRPNNVSDDGPNHDINDDKGGNRPTNVSDDGPNHDINDDKGGDRNRSARDDNCTGWGRECYLSDNRTFIQLPCTERSTVCPDVYEPVCITQCRGRECARNATNSCNACADPDVIAYTPGLCEANRTVCRQSARGLACTALSQPVCAYWANCTQEPCGQTIGNGCVACRQQNASYYVAGECGSSAV